MVDPISSSGLSPASPLRPAGGMSPVAEAGEGADFAAQLRQQLEQVSRLQAEAEQGMQDLLTGRSDDLTGVLTMARKADVAFSLLMEIRNKLLDAYTELRQLRV